MALDVGGDDGSSVALRVFLEAARTGDVARVDRYIAQGGDVNATLGECWTALHYAVTRGHMRVLQRLLQEKTLDVNATTTVGTSAIGIAIRLHSNVIIRMLMDSGASRATVGTLMILTKPITQEATRNSQRTCNVVAQEELRVAWDSTWISSDVQQRLHPSWSIVWSRRTQHRFSSQEREKARLIMCINSIAATSDSRVDNGSKATQPSPASTLAAWLWDELFFMKHGAKHHAPRNEDGGHDQHGAFRRWMYLPPSAVQLVLEFALFLW